MTIEFLVSLCLGIGLAASVGFRVFLPLLVLSVATHLDYIPLNDSWQWLGSWAAIITLVIATVFEILAYYIPWFDNALDTVAVPLATVAGTAVMVATMTDVDPLIRWTLAIIAGGGTATAISSSTGATRLVSTAATGGIANPLVSTVETAGATAMSVMSLFFPFIAAIIAIFLIVGVRKLYTKLKARNRQPVNR